MENKRLNTDWIAGWGTEIHMPKRFMFFPTEDYVPTKWEIRRNEIICKMKRKKAFRNRLAKYALMVIAFVFSCVMWVLIGGLIFPLVSSPFEYGILGVAIGLVICINHIYFYMLIDSKFETHPPFIKIKHRGKIY